jgi:hypothetical protein
MKRFMGNPPRPANAVTVPAQIVHVPRAVHPRRSSGSGEFFRAPGKNRRRRQSSQNRDGFKARPADDLWAIDNGMSMINRGR